MTTAQATFASIPGFPLYEISDQGDIRRILKSGAYRPIKPYLNDKHRMVSLVGENGTKSHYLHRLVMITFGPPQPDNRPLVLHLNDNPEVNHLDNLIWGNKRMNGAMAVLNGRLRPHDEKVFLNMEEAQWVRALYAAGQSQTGIAKQLGCSRYTVRNVVFNRIQRLAVSEVQGNA